MYIFGRAGLSCEGQVLLQERLHIGRFGMVSCYEELAHPSILNKQASKAEAG